MKNMQFKLKNKERVSKMLALSLLITLTMFQILYATFGIVTAVSQELETQNNTTNQKNVTFDAFFKNQEGNNRTIKTTVKEGAELTFNIGVDKTGGLNNAKISIEKSNFKIQEVENRYIKKINTETNEIELNQLIAGNEVEITIPIVFNNIETLDKEYISKETTVKITGNYKDGTNKQKTVEKETKIRVSWTEEPEITINQGIEKYINLEGNCTLIQQNINLQITDDILVQDKVIETEVPEIQRTLPDKVQVLVDGEQTGEQNYTYDKQNKKVNIKNGKNREFKVIYQYPIKYEKELQITLNTKVQTKLYTEETTEKQDQKEIQVQKTTNNVSIQNTSTENIYKGKIYIGAENKTEYQEKLSIELSSLEQINEIEISKMEDYFINQNGTKISTNNNTYINNIKLNKNNIENVLGQDFEIKILDENNQDLKTITKQSDWDQNSNINIQLEEITLNTIKVILNAPKNIGTLNIELDKYIKGNAGYNKQIAKTFTNLENTKVIKVAGEEIQVSSISTLQDTITEARLEISNTNLTTAETIENVQINAILKSDSEKYDLYKNPYIEVKLPEELKQINVKAINVVYGEELSTVKAGYNPNNKTIELQFNGEQTQYKKHVEEGIHVVITADLTFKMDIPNKETKIIMTYTNENADQQQHETSVDVKINSKYGAILYNSIHNYNEENEVSETTENTELYGQLDIQGEEKRAIVYQSFINNYEEPINNVVMIGNIQEKNVQAKVNNINTDNNNVKIYYSEKENETAKSNSWTENAQDLKEIKSYKIELKGQLEPSDKIQIAYGLDIPANLEQGVQLNQDTNVTYNYKEQEGQSMSSVVLTTGAKPAETVIEEIQKLKTTALEEQGIRTEVVAISANKALKEGDEVPQGQAVRYNVKITNNTGKDLNNFKFIAEHTNVIYYGKIEEEGTRTDKPEPEIIIFTRQDENLKNITNNLEILKNGETATFTYKFIPKGKAGEKVEGNIKMQADDIEQQQVKTITNTIAKSDISVEILDTTDEKIELKEKETTSYGFDIKNRSGENQKDIILNVQTANLEFLEYYDGFYDDLGIEFMEIKEDGLIIKIPELKKNESIGFKIFFLCKEIPNDIKDTNITIYGVAQLKGKAYYTDTLTRDVGRIKADVIATQNSNKANQEVKIGDKIIYTAEITNNDKVMDANNLNLSHRLTLGSTKIERAYLKNSKDEITEVQIDRDNQAQTKCDLKVGETIQYIAEVSVKENEDEEINSTDDILSEMSLIWDIGNLELNTVEVSIAKANSMDEDDDWDEDEDPDSNPDTPGTNPDRPNSDTQKPGSNSGESGSNQNGQGVTKNTYSISGIAWIDKNRDGQRNSNEKQLDGIEVKLLNANNGTIAKDINNKEATTITQGDGTYIFNQIPEGNYIVVFYYDTVQYSITQYQKESISQDINSDIIVKTLKEETVAATDILTISNSNITNIDAGFIENVKFDFSLNKTINRIIIQSKEGLKTIECAGSKLAKAEINAKYLQGATVLVEYSIEVKNEGEISGYASDIIDYMPKDLKFSSEINRTWYTDPEGNLHNVSLSNTAIKPGESKKLTLTLTKAMTTQNTGLSVNIAEIGQQTNELSIKDEDSTPGNRKDGEDDISTAELLTSIKTGGGVTITISIVLMIMLILITIIIYRKREGGE